MADLYLRWRAFQAGARRPAPASPAADSAPRRFRRCLPWPAEPLPREWVLLDLETSGLRGAFAFLAGVARVDGDGLEVTQWLLGDLPGEAAFLRAVRDELAGAAVLLTYNGKTFDWPLLRDRARLAGLGDDWPEPACHRDLLHEVRAIWGRGLPRCGLADVERSVLGLAPRDGDAGGREMPALYRAYLAGDEGAVAAILDHNLADLRTLAALAARCRALEAGGEAGEAPATLLGLAGWRLRRGDRAGARRALAAWSAAVTAPERHDALRAAELYRRLGCWDEAAGLWRQLAEGPFGSVAAALALAGYLERRRRDPQAALRLIEAVLQRPWLPPARRAELLARRERLQAGRGRRPAPPRQRLSS